MEDNNVDTTKELTVVEWFTGYGGNELGLRRVIPAMRPIAFCEREAFVVANLVSKMEAGLLDPVPVWTDVTTFPIEPFVDRVGLFVASYPCQPFSHAGKRNGQNDERHLWPACRRFICGAHPQMVFLENVEGHVTLGLSTVLADLEEDGYTAAWGIFSASEVGAPHQRKRVFILAYDKSMQCDGHNDNSGVLPQQQEVPELGNSGRQNAMAYDVPRGELADTRPVPGCSESRKQQEELPQEFSGRSELALRDSIGGDHGEPKEQPAEAGANAQRRPSAASSGEDVAYGGLQRPEVNELKTAGSFKCGSEDEPTPGDSKNVAHNQHEGPQGHAGDVNGEGREPEGQTGPATEESICGNVWPSRPGQAQYGWEPPRVIGEREQRYTVNTGDGSDNAHTEQHTGGATIEQTGGGERQAQPPMGGNADGTAPGVDFARLSGLSDTELAEIREWMGKGTNRTDELRLNGNGVVPATAERAFRVLCAELCGAPRPALPLP
jgi:DNA (cytosine-5)-methyltransferase 1